MRGASQFAHVWLPSEDVGSMSLSGLMDGREVMRLLSLEQHI